MRYVMGCDKKGIPLTVRGQLRKRRKKIEAREGLIRDLKRKEATCDDTYRAEKEAA